MIPHSSDVGDVKSFQVDAAIGPEVSRSAVTSGARFLLSRKHASGLIGSDFTAFHKLPLALKNAGFENEATQQLAVIRRVAFENRKFRPQFHNSGGEDKLLSYYLGWLTFAAIKLEDREATASFGEAMLEYQDQKSGGFYSLFGVLKKEVHAVHTSVCGAACLGLGELDRAIRAGDFLVRLCDLQPDPDRVYYRTDEDGRLLKSYPVDRMRSRQRYAVLGKMTWFLSELYRATRREAYRRTANQMFNFAVSCQNDIFHRVGSAILAYGFVSIQCHS